MTPQSGSAHRSDILPIAHAWRPWGWTGRTGKTIPRLATVTVAAACLFLPSPFGTVRSSVPKKVYTYEVSHPVHGTIGTYTNTIEDNGTEVSVRNRIRVLVKLLLIVAHDQSSESEEKWRGGRLVAFESVNRENGKENVVKGRAKGDKFVVETPTGQVEAPANIFPNNPWSMDILKASVLLGTKSGSLYRVRASSGEERTLKLGDRSVKTQYYKVDGDAKYELWFDERGVAVKFTDRGDDDVITFRLVDGSKKLANEKPAEKAIKGNTATP